MRRRHDALVVVAMRQAEAVSQLVYGRLGDARRSEALVARQAVELLRHPKVRHDRAASAELRLAEDEGEDRDVEVERRDGDQQLAAVLDARELLEDRRGVVLPALGVVRGSYVDGESFLGSSVPRFLGETLTPRNRGPHTNPRNFEKVDAGAIGALDRGTRRID